MPNIAFAMNKHGGRTGRKFLSATMAVLLAAGLLPAASLASPAKAYADDGDGTRNPEIKDYLEENIDANRAPVSRDEGLFASFRSIFSGEASSLNATQNALIVKNTMVDGSQVAEGEGFEEIYSTEERVGDALLGQFESLATVYDPGKDSPCYVAFVDTASMGGTAKVIDWQAAEFNVMGELIDGIYYDAGTGIAYIDKGIYDDQDGHIVQLQLLCSYNFDAPAPKVDVRIDNANGDVTAVAKGTSVEVAPMDVTIDIPVATPETAAAIDVYDLEVHVNGAEEPVDPASGENMTYDTATGVLTIAQNASTVASVDVTVHPRGLFAPERAYAVTAESMRAMKDYYGNEAVLTEMDPDLVQVGQAYKYTGFIQYFSADTTERRRQVLNTLWDSLYIGDIQNELISGSGFSFSDIWSPKDEGYGQHLGDSGNGGFDLVNTFDFPNAQRIYGEMTDYYPSYGDSVVGGVNWTGFPRTNDSYGMGWQGVAQCAHIGQNGWVEKVDNGDTSDYIGQITMRILHKADDYIVVGFVLPTINTQTGAAVYKIKYESKGQVEIQKGSANSALTDNNNCYTFEGIQYGVYADQACAQLVTTLTLDASGYAKSEEIKKGAYWVKEIASNSSYAPSDAVQRVEVGSGDVAKVEVTDEPLEDPDGLIVRKYDADTNAFVATGDAKLGLAEYTYEYVDSYVYNSDQFDAAKAGSKAARTWVLRTNENGYTDLRYGNDSFSFEGQSYTYKASGDAFYVNQAGNITLPLGTVRIHETKAPSGYNLSEKVYLVRIVPDPANPSQTKFEGDSGLIQDGNTATEATAAAEEPIRGGVTIYKRDAETREEFPMAGTDWSGVSFEIVNRSAAEVTYDGVKVPVGSVVTTIAPAADNGKATTGENKLQFGTYGIREVTVSDGYKMSDTEERVFEIREQGQMVVLDGDDAVYNQIKRGDLEFVKIADKTNKRMANVPFMVTSKATGESHVIVTDANGQAKTSADWNAHSAKTNANDAAVDAEGNVDESKLDSYAGIWFGLDSNGNPTAADDNAGALPYGDYTITELRSPANTGYELVTADVQVRRDAVSIDMGTITDVGEKPLAIGTSARDGIDGDRLLVKDPMATIVDRVEFFNAVPGTLYRFVGTLMDKTTGEPVHDADGNPVTAQAVKVAENETGFVEMPFTFDATLVEGDVVVFEQMYVDGEDQAAAVHEDLDDYYQTVKLYEPSIGTTLTDGADGDKLIVADETVRLVDTVAYKNLVAGQEHEAQLVVMKVVDGEASVLTDAEGNPVTATVLFTPEESSGTVDVAVEFPGELVSSDMNLVAYEKLFRLGVEIASHEDPTDPGQTVTVVEPSIGTLATDAKDGDKEIEAAASVVINDAVAYENLFAGREYVMNLTVMQKTEDGATPLLDTEGKPYTAELAFTPEAADGTVNVTVEIDATELAGEELVMYEVLTLDGKVIATHEDPDDEGQTVHVTEPKIGTTATDKTDGDHKILASRTAVIVDEVSYTGLIPGEEYVLSGILMDKETGKPLIAGDSEVRNEIRFTPNSPNGTVTIEFTFDATALGGKSIVVFEELSKDGKPVAEHKDIDDAAQTVEVVTPLATTGTTPAPATGTYAKTGVDTAQLMLFAGLVILAGACVLLAVRKRAGKDGSEQPSEVKDETDGE